MNDQLPPGPTDQEINDRLEAIENGVLTMLTLEKWITSDGKYPERAKSPDLTDEVRNKATILISTINSFLAELNFQGPIKVSSGFRPVAVNASLANSAKRSLHCTGSAIDIEDPSGTLDNAIKSRPELLDKFGLWLEDPGYTPGWTHLDLGVRRERPIRIFIP